MKTMKMRITGILFLLVCFSSGCFDQAAEVDLPTYTKRIAITCYLSPKDPNISLELGYTLPYFGKQNGEIPRVGDAKVVLSDLTTGKTVQLPFDSSIMLYRVRAFALPIVNGHEYRADVTLNDGTTFWSKTTIPAVLQEKDLRLGKIILGKLENSNWGGQMVNLVVELKSAATQTGYFYAPRFDAVIEDGLGDFYGSSLYFPKDGIEEGKSNDVLKYLFNDRIYLDGGFGGGIVEDPLVLKELVGTFWVMDKGYKERYVRDIQNTGNPFAEPILLYSNWNNGAVGALGSYDWVEAVIVP